MQFRQRMSKSQGVVKEIHATFNELIEKIHLDPPELVSVGLEHGDFHELVKMLRIQAIAVHIDWRKSVDSEADQKSLSAVVG